MTGIACEGQGYKIDSIKSLNFPIDLKAQHHLGAPEVLPFQDPAVFQFKCIRRCCTRHKESERHHGQKMIPFAHCSLSIGNHKFPVVSALSPTPLLQRPSVLDVGDVANGCAHNNTSERENL